MDNSETGLHVASQTEISEMAGNTWQKLHFEYAQTFWEPPCWLVLAQSFRFCAAGLPGDYLPGDYCLAWGVGSGCNFLKRDCHKEDRLV